jgi:hypothetical protein
MEAPIKASNWMQTVQTKQIGGKAKSPIKIGCHITCNILIPKFNSEVRTQTPGLKPSALRL